MNASCELPKMLPLRVLTPTMRNCEPEIVIGLVERVDLAEQLIGHVPAEQHHRLVALDLDCAHQPSALGVEHREALSTRW